MVSMLKIWWKRLSGLPGGIWFFSRAVGFLIPYTGSIRPRVEEARPGFARVSMPDRRAVRNHLHSLHAVALVNLGEFTTGIATHFAMADDDRAILTNISAEYLRKARGRITATATLEQNAPLYGPIVVKATLFNEDNAVVAVVEATWLVGKNNKS